MRLHLLPLLCLLALLVVPASAHAAQASGDFNGDGRADLAVGVQGESVGSVAQAGAVNVLYGGADTGLTATGDQLWHQDRAGVQDTAEPGDHFGAAVTTGDFNGDGFADLAIGVPDETVSSLDDAGAVNVLYGSPAGLSAAGDQLWHQDRAGVQDSAGAADHFGQALAAGDLNGDGRDDLAAGVPQEDIVLDHSEGAVNVLYGSAGTGLTATGDQLWHQDRAGVEGTAESLDLFGTTLTTGDLNGDGFADLAVGVQFESVGDVEDAGAVNVLYGSAGTGLTATGDQLWHQDRAGVEDTAEGFDRFSNALTAGDLNGDGKDDLAVGVPDEDFRGMSDAGAVNVLYGSAGTGLTATGDQLWHQDRAAVRETAEDNDRFGWAVSAGDLDGDGKGDLAVAVPDESVGSVAGAGAVNVLYGTAGTGLSAAGNQVWHQNRAGVEGIAETSDTLGSALATGDLNGDGREDLAVGAAETVGSVAHAGAANVLYGAADGGLSAAGDQIWHQNQPGVEDRSEVNDLFGFALGSGAVGGP